MKRFISILFVSFYSCIWNYAQTSVSGIYKIDNFDVTLSCYIEFYVNENYQLIIEERMTSDIVESTVLSCGHFSIKKDILTLFDSVQGFKMEFSISKTKQLVVIQGFTFLIGKVLTFDQDIYTKYMNPRINPDMQQKNRTEYLRIHTDLYPFYYGKYESVFGYQLNLKEDKQYTLFYKNVLISEGRWERQKNEVILFDTHLQHPSLAVVCRKIM